MNCKALPEHKLTKFPDPRSSAGIPNTKPTKLESSPYPKNPNPRLRDFLKHVGLLLPDALVGRAFAWRSSTERPKVAAYHSRSVAVSNSLLHLAPLIGAIVLLVFFWMRLWVGESSSNATALQFVAKLHELLMQASLVDVLLCTIRYQALHGHIPLGALSAAAKAPQLSYLWSLDFLSAVQSPTFTASRKIVFTFSTLGLVLMTALVGPSSAVLMIPRPDMARINNTITRYLNVSDDTMFPIQINNTHNMNLSRYNEFEQMRLSEASRTADTQNINKYVWESDKSIFGAYGPRRNAYQIIRQNPAYYTIATIPTILSFAQLLKHNPIFDRAYANYDELYAVKSKSANLRWTLQSSQPVVFSRCTPGSSDAKDLYYFRDDGSQSLLPNATELYKPLLDEYRGTNVLEQHELPPAWIASPGDSKLLLALFIKPKDNAGYEPHLSVCTIWSFWQEITTTLTSDGVRSTIQTNPPMGKEATTKSNMKEIVLESELMSSLGAPCRNYDIALCLAAALSHVPAYSTTYRTIDRDTRIGYDRSEIDSSMPFTAFTILETIYGYGYGATDTSVCLSVAVMIAYCIITVLYISYTIITGHTSTAWGSPTELIMLALQSKEPDHLGHVSVGLDSMETFRQSVSIRVNTASIGDTGETREKLELVFDHDEETEKRGLTRVVPNRAY